MNPNRIERRELIMKGNDMKQLILKSDGSPIKSKLHAIRYLEKNGISKDALIEENGQFFYEDAEVFAEQIANDKLPKAAEIFEHTKPQTAEVKHYTVDWETPVFDKNNERTKLFIPGTDVIAVINGKHPAGQNRLKSSFEISIDGENFIMSLDLMARIFKVKEV